MSVLILENAKEVFLGDVICRFKGSDYGCGRRVAVYYRILEFCGNRTKVVKVNFNAAKNGFLKTQCKPVYHCAVKEGSEVYRERPTK